MSGEQPTAQEPEEQKEDDEARRPTLAELFAAVDELNEKITAHLSTSEVLADIEAGRKRDHT